jgi:hypothetical protein
VPAAVAIEDVNFQAMLDRSREFRERVDALGISSAGIRAYVHGRLHSHTQPPQLPLKQRELGDKIVELLKDPRLTPWQAHQLEQAFFFGK